MVQTVYRIPFVGADDSVRPRNPAIFRGPGGKSKTGGRGPLLGRFKGIPKKEAPARIQRSNSCGKRRNNETDETCRLRRGEGYGACEDEPPEAQLRYYRILPHAGACQQPLRQNLRFCHLPLHRGGFGRTASSAPTDAISSGACPHEISALFRQSAGGYCFGA